MMYVHEILSSLATLSPFFFVPFHETVAVLDSPSYVWVFPVTPKSPSAGGFFPIDHVTVFCPLVPSDQCPTPSFRVNMAV